MNSSLRDLFFLSAFCIVAFGAGPDCSKIANSSCCSAAVISRCMQRCATDAAIHCPALLQRILERRNDTSNLLRRKPVFGVASVTQHHQQAVQPSAQLHAGGLDITAVTAQPTEQVDTTQIPQYMYDEYSDNEQEITPATPPPLDSLDEMTVTSSPAERYNEIRAVGDHAQTCGVKKVDFTPCIDVKTANGIFEQCCAQFVDVECQSLCRYALQRDDARGMLLSAVEERRCSLRNLNSVLHCASQNGDNRECCRSATTSGHMSSACSDRFCDPLYGIGRLSISDLPCLADWHRIMFCHLSGLR